MILLRFYKDFRLLEPHCLANLLLIKTSCKVNEVLLQTNSHRPILCFDLKFVLCFKISIGSPLVLCRKEGKQNGDFTAYITLEIELLSSYALMKVAARKVSCEPGDRHENKHSFEIKHNT